MKNHSLISKVSLLLLLAFLFSGCAGSIKNMRTVPPDRAEFKPEQGGAMLVFMRPSGVGFAIQSSVFEVKESKVTSLAGIVAAKTKVAYRLDPGKHLFMVVGESADFMTAEVQAGKTYYAYVTPRMGVWKARFSLAPIHKQELNASDFNSDLENCQWVEKSPESEAWMQDNMEDLESKRAEYYPEWMEKDAADRPHLLPGDGK